MSTASSATNISNLLALPKTRSGKILQRFLKAKETGADTGDVSTMEG